MSITYIQAQNTLGQFTTVNQNALISFDRIDPMADANVSYANSIFTIKEPGLYYVNWSIVTSGTVPADPNGIIKISIVSTGANNITTELSVQNDEIAGSGIIRTESPNTMIYLINDGAAFMYGMVPVVANIVIISIDSDTGSTGATGGTGAAVPECGCGSVVNFSNGGIDPTNPFTWPLIFQALQISWTLNRIIDLKTTLTREGLEILLDLPKGALGNFIIDRTLGPILESTATAIEQAADDMTDAMTKNSGMVSMDAYIGHSTMGVVPAVFGVDLPVLSLVAGGPYPQIIARNGTITSFSAQYGALAAIDVSLLGAIQGVLATVNQIIYTVAGVVATLASAIASIGPMLAGIGAPLPSDFAEILNRIIIKQLEIDTASTNHHMHAVLWHATRDVYYELGGAVKWHKVADLDLGAIPFAELGPFDSILSLFGDILSAGGNVVSSLLTLLGSHGTPNLALHGLPLNANTVTGLEHEVKNGDYLTVQFTLMGDDNTTILAGVLASDLMASALIK